MTVSQKQNTSNQHDSQLPLNEKNKLKAVLSPYFSGVPGTLSGPLVGFSFRAKVAFLEAHGSSG